MPFSAENQKEIADIEKELSQINSTLSTLQKQKKDASVRGIGRKVGAIGGPIGQFATSQVFREPGTPGPIQAGGFLDKNVLSGQLPAALGLVGGAVGGVPGAGFGGAAGRSIENPIRQVLGLSPPMSLADNFKTAGLAGLNMAAGEGVGQIGGKLLGVAGDAIKSIARSKPIAPFVQNAANRLATSSVPQSTTQIAKSVEEGTPTLGQQLAQRGQYGFKQTIFDYAKAGKEKFGKWLGEELDAAASQGIDPNKAAQALDDVEKRFLRTGNKEAAKIIENRKAAWLDSVLNNKEKLFLKPDEAVGKGLLSPSEANILKREFASEASSVFKQENFDAVSGVNAEFAHALAKGLRREIEKVVPNAEYLNKEFHFYDQLSNAISTGIARDLQKGGLTIAQPFSTGAAAGTGLALGGPAGAIAGGTGVQLARTFPVKTYLAAQLTKLAGKEITPELASQVSSQMLAHPTFRKAIFKAISSIGTFNALQGKNNK